MSESDRIDVKVLGRTLGTASGWDGDMDVFTFYDFKAKEGIELPSDCDLQILIEEGLFGMCNAATGEQVNSKDFVTFMMGVPRDV